MTDARSALRAATAAEHERLDALFARFDLGERVAYGRFLLAHAAALLAVEEALDVLGAPALIPDWRARRRGALIRADLAALGLTTPRPLAAPALDGEAGMWGAAYVVEGSRLGGALLARRVAPGLPTAYLAAAQAPGAWRAFIAMLDAANVSDDRQRGATAGARATFAMFEAAAREQLRDHQETCAE